MVFIKSLKVNGFKSFAQSKPTEFVFKEGIGGFVGPNGCGKSNVFDAIRWALGEQKASAFRVSQMQDVIFGGSAEKVRAGMAECELVLGNEESLLPMEYNEITITRRLYRSGESEYMINRQPCLLKDIRSLFLDTGIGKSSYSVIEQNQITNIVDSDPEERRTLFEEAASISKINEQKRDSLRKLEKTKENIVRIEDIIREQEKQHKNLKKQAEAADRYNKIRDQLQELEIDNYLYDLVQINKQKDDLLDRLKKTDIAAEEAQKKANEFKEKIDTLTSRIEDKKIDINTYEKRESGLSEKILSVKQQISLLKEQRLETQNRVKELLEIADENEIKIKRIEERTEKTKEEIQAYEKKIKENSDIQKEKENRAEVLKNKVERYKKEEKEFVSKSEEIQKEEARLNKEHSVVIENFVQELDKIKSRTDNSQVQSTKDLKAALKTFNQMTDEILPGKGEEEFHIWFDKVLDREGKNSKNDYEEILKTTYEAVFALREKAAEIASESEKILNQKDPVYDLIYSTEGSYARKEDIDRALERIREEGNFCREKIKTLSEETTHLSKQAAVFSQQALEISFENSNIEQSLTMSRRILNEYTQNLEELKSSRSKNDEQIKNQKSLLDSSDDKVKNFEEELERFSQERQKLIKDRDNFLNTITKNNHELSKLHSKEQVFRKKIENLKQKHFNLEIELNRKEDQKSMLYKQCRDRYSEDLKSYEKEIPNKTFDIAAIKKKTANLTEELKKMGHTNPLAREEFNAVNEELQQNIKQKEDIEKSITDLNEVIMKLDSSAQEQFIETFEKVQTNFHHMVRKLFNGGKGQLLLSNPKDPLKSGVEIMVQPPGKDVQSIKSFSGGEKSLIAAALMFSVFQVKPAPFCLLDEIDAALDTTNIRRLAKILRMFKNRSQFLLISHHQTTTDLMDYVYGITMDKTTGVSRILSLSFEKKEG